MIHAVGPVYRGLPRDAELLASAYRSSLELASQHGIRSLAFPSISTGIYGYPIDQAAPIALRTVGEHLAGHPGIELVRFVLWSRDSYAAFKRAAHNLFRVTNDA